MTAEPYPFPVICGARENRPDGRYECVQPPRHDSKAHTWVRLTVRPAEGAA